MTPNLRTAPLLKLRPERCQGCTRCIRHCPTEAIRIRRGKAQVMEYRCVQCGRCIPACPWNAWEVRVGAVGRSAWKQATAILDPTVFWQFGGRTSPEEVAAAFLRIGFGSVQDLGQALEIYARGVSAYLSSPGGPVPAISSACPAVVQLVQVKYPSLIENLVPILSPLEIFGLHCDDGQAGQWGMRPFYIVPCLAQAVAARSAGFGGTRTFGAIPLADLYNRLKTVLLQKKPNLARPPEIRPTGMGWAVCGGQSEALGMEASLVVDGVHAVADLLELAESGVLHEVPFVEAWACAGGCLGGALNLQNPHWARYHLRTWLEGRESPSAWGEKAHPSPVGELRRDPPPQRPGIRLDENIQAAMEKLHRIDEVVKSFPGIDCGSCGCPTCLALAEDVVQGHARMEDCLGFLKGSRTRKKRRTGGQEKLSDAKTSVEGKKR